VVDELINSLRKEARDSRDYSRRVAERDEIGYAMGMLPERPGPVSPELVDTMMKRRGDRIDIAAKALERFNAKPSKQQEKEAAEWLAFDNALKKVDEMMAKEKDWNRNIDKFAIRVIDEIKPICQPKKFAETLKRLMEFRKDDAVLQELSAVFSPLYFRNFARMMGRDMSDKELEELFGKGKDRMGQFIQGEANEDKARELLALSEAILKKS